MIVYGVGCIGLAFLAVTWIVYKVLSSDKEI